ncbi:MAG: phosphotransferase [Rhodopirellula sp. JB053]
MPSDFERSPELCQWLLQALSAQDIVSVQRLQSLWSGYGEIVRVELSGGPEKSVIVKYVSPPTQKNHPRGWNTSRSHERKLRSYEIESNWYRSWSDRCDADCRVARCLAEDTISGGRVLVLEDLDAAGFQVRRHHLDSEGVAAGLRWLAHFHATFMGTPPFLEDSPNGLWPTGCYWHLQTRPDEWEAMPVGPLKNAAKAIDDKLQSARFQTLVHGDAKVANFCFADAPSKAPAMVDFQYVGRGCGMKDVAYFLGSCLNETQCEQFEETHLKIYFETLRGATANRTSHPDIDNTPDIDSLEYEWRDLYPMAWADFVRFLEGWCPGHAKLHRYSRGMVETAIEKLNAA